MKIASALPLALFVVRAQAYSGQGLKKLTLGSSSPAPAPAGAAPAGPAAAVAALRVTFEIKNYNYYDLTKETCPKAVQLATSSKEKGKKADVTPAKGAPDFNNALDEISSKVDAFGRDVANGAGVAAEKSGDKPPPPPWMEKKAKGASFVETERVCVLEHRSLAAIHSKSDACKTVMDVFRAAIEEVVRDVIKCTAAKASSAPASAQAGSPATLEPLPPQQQAFLQKVASAPAAAAASAPGAAGIPDPAIFITFSPGKEVGSGRSVLVEITFTDKPNNGMDDVAMTKPIIQRSLDNGSLVREVKAALEILTGLIARLGKMTMKTSNVDGWNVSKCKGHIKSLVNTFSHTYTKEQVPMALYNECTTFMTRMSFSNDYVLDRMDTVLCRKTTAKFAKHWNFGEKASGEDFELMCVRSCEAKFGKNAPQCNVEAGDSLAGKPL